MASCKSCGCEFYRDDGEAWKVYCPLCWAERKNGAAFEGQYLKLESRVSDSEELITYLMNKIRALEQEIRDLIGDSKEPLPKNFNVIS